MPGFSEQTRQRLSGLHTGEDGDQYIVMDRRLATSRSREVVHVAHPSARSNPGRGQLPAVDMETPVSKCGP